MPTVRLAHYILGLHGVAVIRGWLGDEQEVAPRIRELSEFAVGLDQNPSNTAFELHDDEVPQGYAAWSLTYDHPVNPLVDLEQPIVRSFIDTIPAGRALDAACGTGRHTEYLCARGFDTTGVDLTPEMLAIARRKVPAAQFIAGDVSSLEFPDATFDVAVCALALEHYADLHPSVAGLARVVRAGGAIIISTFHPMSASLGGGAFYRDAHGSWGKVHTAGHRVSDYINAFVEQGLEINACVEPPWRDSDVAMMRVVSMFLKPETMRAALVGIPCALVWRLTRRRRIRWYQKESRSDSSSTLSPWS